MGANISERKLPAAFRRTVRDVRRTLRFGEPSKADAELAFWRSVRKAEGQLTSEHFQFFFTTYFGLEPEFYEGKALLDIGCGPRGSLEWASMAAERVGLDPLVGSYRELGIDEHRMTYVESGAEDIPFRDGHFDVVSSFNSLDHVDALQPTIAEIKRALKPGGTFLLVTDVNHDPTPTEPIEFSWDIVESFAPEFTPFDVRHFEKSPNGVYQSVAPGVPYDHENETRRYGVLSARFVKQELRGEGFEPA